MARRGSRGTAAAIALAVGLLLPLAAPVVAGAPPRAGPPTFSVTFQETGLPAGTPWGIDLPTGSKQSRTSSVVFFEPPGTYVAQVEFVLNYDPNTSEVTVMVTNGPGVYFIGFTKNLTPLPTGDNPSPDSTASPPISAVEWTVILVAIGGLVVAAYYLTGRRAPRSPPRARREAGGDRSERDRRRGRRREPKEERRSGRDRSPKRRADDSDLE